MLFCCCVHGNVLSTEDLSFLRVLTEFGQQNKTEKVISCD